MLNNVPIARKLALLCAVFLIPVLLLAWLLFDHSSKATRFAEKEIEGTAYLTVLTKSLAILTQSHWDAQGDNGSLDASALNTLKDSGESLATIDAALGAAMQSSTQTSQARQELAAYMAKGQQLTPDAHLQSLKALRAIIARVGDHSNLILDPDLDSYYVMDMTVLRLPALVNNVENATSILWTMRAATPSDQQHFMDTLSAVRAQLEAINEGITVAIENNPSGTLAASLRPHVAKMLESTESYAHTLELASRMVQGGLDFDRSEIIAAHAAMQTTLYQSWAEGINDLKVLLNTRISGLQTELWFSMSASTIALVLAAVLAMLMARSINRPLSDLEKLMGRLADGETNITIPFRQRQDEVGRMARALEIFRENAEGTQRMKAALDCVGTPVLVASSDGQLSDLNHAARQHFQKHADAIRQDIPDFDISKALGTPFEDAFPNAALHGLLQHCKTGQQRGQIALGDRSFDVRVNAVVSERGERLGMVSEWIDISERLRMEHDIAQLVEAGIAGDFSRRLDVDSQRGFLRTLAEKMNEFVDTVSESLGDLVEVNGVLAQGDLMRRIDRPYEGAFQALADNTNQMADRLAEIVRKIAEAAHAVHNASGEIAQGSEDLATRTEQQAANLEETAAAMEQLAVTVRQNAHSAQQADELAEDARAAAERGGLIVEPAVTAMGRIEESSGKISEITTVIEEIAFQTNLLALNAAVEAARAGDAGRGFAVVAAEVRQLAQRTSRSSKEIKEIIQRSNAHVQDGVKMVGEVGKALAGIVDLITSVASIIGEIASASREQSSGLDEVNAAVAQMDEMTQQNAALVEETTAAAHSLSVQAEGLVDLVSYFRVHDADNAPYADSNAWGQPAWNDRGGYGRYAHAEDAEVEEINSLSHRPVHRASLGHRAPVVATPNRQTAGSGRPRGTGPAKEPPRKGGSRSAGWSSSFHRPVQSGGQSGGQPSPQASSQGHASFDNDADWSEF